MARCWRAVVLGSARSRVGAAAAAVAEEAAAVLLVPRSGWCGGARFRWRDDLHVNRENGLGYWHSRSGF
jgi:hypothetical protein